LTVADLAQKLISFPSVTPHQAGCLDFIEAHLTELGFQCWRLPFGDIPALDDFAQNSDQRVEATFSIDRRSELALPEEATRKNEPKDPGSKLVKLIQSGYVANLYARWGTALPNICFAGHVDVVPVPDPSAWDDDPFPDHLVTDQLVYGRGAVDMKGGIAAFLTALPQIQSQMAHHALPGSISLLLTSDEEGKATHGTCKVVDWLKEKGETLTSCLVGEPTSVTTVGDMVKVGRRGSLNAHITVTGQAGHVAYPENFVNPTAILLAYLSELKQVPLDEGTEFFQPSNLEITSIDTGNPVTNSVPAKAEARLNIRFNSRHTGASLRDYLIAVAHTISPRIQVDVTISGEAFYCRDDHLTAQVSQAIQSVTGQSPVLSTSGGTSDARFIKEIAPVIEVGLLNRMAHQDNEQVPVTDLDCLTSIYAAILKNLLKIP
jgi:succinyl-diaminopimelate desuccinylase